MSEQYCVYFEYGETQDVISDIFADDDPTCSPNEEYNVCGTSCEQTCQEIGAAPRLCNHMCVVGCFCVAGYVRPNGQSNSCIKEADC